MELDAGSGADGWAARLTSDYGRPFLSLINGSYSTDGGWTLFFEVPRDIRPELYSLNVAYSDGGYDVNYTQPRSVWILEEWPERLRIGHISDTHLPYGADLFASYVYEVNLMRPDLVVCTGDVVDAETLTSAWIYLHGILDRLDVPSFFLPGNHDYAGAESAYYQRYCGGLNYSAVVGRFLFIALDTSDAGYVALDQLRWAERVLQRHPGKVKIMGFHHPLFSAGDGGSIDGSWERFFELTDYAYSSWEEHPAEARELLRLIEQYDVRLVLAGHVHRDVMYVYNDRHYFATVVTVGGSLPPGFYHGARLIEIDADGNVVFDEYAERAIYEPPNSIPVGQVEYYYRGANDGTEAAVSATIVNTLEMELKDVILEFHVSGEYGIEDYDFRRTEPTRFETETTERGHRFTAYFDVPPTSAVHVTLAAVEDDVEPAVVITPLGEIEEDTPVSLEVEVSDEGWGVEAVDVRYSVDGGRTWTGVPLASPLRVDKEESVLEYPTAEYEITIPGQAGGTELLVRVDARDYAGNSKQHQAAYTVGPTPTATYTLTVETSPIDIGSLKVDGRSYSTPFAATLAEGRHTVTVPEEVAPAIGKYYDFVRWKDGVPGSTRTVDLHENTTLVAIYEAAPPPLHRLTVTSTPVVGIPLTIDGRSQITLYSATLEEGPYTVSAPAEATVNGETYRFVRWDDGATDATRTIDLTSDRTLTAHYEAAPSQPTVPLGYISAAGVAVAVSATVIVIFMKRRR